MGCMGFNVVDMVLQNLNKKFKAQGLVSILVELDNGSTIRCWVPEKRPENKPNLLLIHGFGGNGTAGWISQVPAFAKDYSLFVPDLIFFGESYTKSRDRSEEFQALCMLKLLQHQNVTEVSVLGTSYGGMVAFYLGHLAPLLVKKVVIASSGVCMDSSSNDKLLNEFNASHISEVLMPTNPSHLKRTFNLLMHQPSMLINMIPGFIFTDYQDVFDYNREERIELLDGMIIGSKNPPSLPVLNQEVLIIWGEGDKIFDLDLAYKLQRHLNDKAKLTIIPKTGHIPQVENPKEFNGHVLQFLDNTLITSN